MRWPWFLGFAGAALVLGKVMSRPDLTYFSASEFGIWWPLMNRDLLLKLDRFRELWGAPVVISKAAGSIGRHGDGNSQHNVDRWGEVRAVDVFPMVPDGAGGFRYMSTSADRQRAYEVAIQAGFTGIGLYTDTQPGNLLHVDNRPGDRVAQWSRVDGRYLGIGEVLA